MKHLALIAFFATPAMAVDNTIIKDCQAKHNYNGLNETKTWSDIATCIVTEKNKIRFAEEDRLWEFMKKHPHYRYPGMALPNGAIKPLDRCWGADKTYYIGADEKKKARC